MTFFLYAKKITLIYAEKNEDQGLHEDLIILVPLKILKSNAGMFLTNHFKSVKNIFPKTLINLNCFLNEFEKTKYYPKIFWQIELWIHPTIRFQGLLTHSSLRLKLELNIFMFLLGLVNEIVSFDSTTFVWKS